MGAFEDEVGATGHWMGGERFAGITRLYSPRQVVEQRGTVPTDYTVARVAAERFHARLRELFDERKSITTFGPYSPGQAVAMKRAGIEGIYLGGWATSAKGSRDEDPGPDLASYPLSQVPDEAGGLVRALLTGDRNQRFARSRMSEEERAATPEVDFTPFIIADADTGHGGDAHVRNLIRRFVEVGVPGYHIEDQKPGAKKCGHQGGKVLVASDEQIKRLNAARLQLDIMGVPGIIVARTDAEAAHLLDGAGDERDQPFVLGVTNRAVPTYKAGFLAAMRSLHNAGVTDVNGHLLYALSEGEYANADAWLERSGVAEAIDEAAREHLSAGGPTAEEALDAVADRFLEAWQAEAGLKTLGQAVAEEMAFRADEGAELPMTLEEWLDFADTASWYTARAKAKEMGLKVIWEPDMARSPEGYHQIQGGIPYAIAKALALAPYADLLWMETSTPDLEEARAFAEAIHASHPGKLLMYNCSPSFNWRRHLDEATIARFQRELAAMGYRFQFITLAGFHALNESMFELAKGYVAEGMPAYVRLQEHEFELEHEGYTATRHQREVGTGWYDEVAKVISGGQSSTTALAGSTEAQQF
jgi:isocitrate lyase